MAVSGGADSVALLRLLLELRRELGIVASAVHFNHELRGAESDHDQQFVTELAQSCGIELRSGRGDVRQRAVEAHLSLEAAARKMRYQFFQSLLREGSLDRIATAHTLDDQAETVLLRLVRGAGTRGLAGIYPLVSTDSAGASAGGKSESREAVIRPLLNTRRPELEAYLQHLGQPWREDTSNRDLRHTRNRLRHGILPRLERHLNPAVRENLADAAAIARAEEDYWQAEVATLLPQVWNATTGRLTLKPLVCQSLAMQRRLVRAAAESLGLHLQFRHVEEIIASLSPKLESHSCLPHGWEVSFSPAEAHFLRSDEVPQATGCDYQYVLPVPGQVEIPELETSFEAAVVDDSEGYNPEHLYDPELLGKEVVIRNWKPGDRFWPAHSKAPKKVKELLQERHVTGDQRKSWPVVAVGEELVWMRGFCAGERLRVRGSGPAVSIRELPAENSARDRK